MEKRQKITPIMLGAVIVFVTCIAGNVLGIISDDNILANLLYCVALLILGIGAIIALISTIKYYGLVLGRAYSSSERKVLAWSLRMLISIFAFIGVGLIGYVLGEFCYSMHIHLSADIVSGFLYIMDALGIIMVGAFVLWLFAKTTVFLNKNNL